VIQYPNRKTEEIQEVLKKPVSIVTVSFKKGKSPITSRKTRVQQKNLSCLQVTVSSFFGFIGVRSKVFLPTMLYLTTLSYRHLYIEIQGIVDFRIAPS